MRAAWVLRWPRFRRRTDATTSTRRALDLYTRVLLQDAIVLLGQDDPAPYIKRALAERIEKRLAEDRR